MCLRFQAPNKTDSELDSRETSSGDQTASLQPTEEPLPSFHLAKRAYKTMTAFYPKTVEDRTSRKVVWKEFLHAMYTVGFEIRQRHGSEWYFEPTWNRNSPITIHEPHPSHEMEFKKIRFEANRMARKYYWNSDTFRLI